MKRRVLAGLVLVFAAFVLLLAATRSPGQGESNDADAALAAATDQGQAVTHRVNIFLNPQSQFSYRDARGEAANTLRVNRGDTIEWTCSAGNWTIIIAGDVSPFSGEVFTIGDRANTVKSLTIRDDAPDGTYKYSVVVMAGRAPRTDDPEIIIGGG